MMGMRPVMSITANRTTNALIDSWILNWRFIIGGLLLVRCKVNKKEFNRKAENNFDDFRFIS